MRVAIFNGADQPISFETFDDPELSPGEIRIEIGRCGLCGSDVSMTSGSAFDYPAGCRMGHEYSGEVVEIGRDVSNLKVGDLVACMPKAGCGQCDSCAEGYTFHCAAGPMLFGGFGDSLVVPQEAAFRLPGSLSLADGALVEPMACGLRALTMAGMKAGDRVVVYGAGSVALAVIYWARQLGAGKVIALSRSTRRRDIAMAVGADAVHGFDEPEELAAALGGPPDIVAECIGVPGMLQKAVEQVKLRGTLISMGMCMAPDAVLPVLCAFKEVRLVFPVGYSIQQFAATVDAFEAGSMDPELMVSHVIPLDAMPATLEAMRSPHDFLKVHVDPKLG